MAFQGWTDPGFDRELAKLSPKVHEQIRTALATLADAPLSHPKVARLHGASYSTSFRMRIGSWRVLGLALASQEIILFTTVFQKKRESDYDAALVRHEKRLARQGPPLGESVKQARRKR